MRACLDCGGSLAMLSRQARRCRVCARAKSNRSSAQRRRDDRLETPEMVEALFRAVLARKIVRKWTACNPAGTQ